jgi:hypothetical protein
MFGWLLASMSGLTRTATRATTPCAAAIRRDAIELAGRLDVDGPDTCRDRGVELSAGLSDAGEHGIRRLEAGAQRHLQFAHRNSRRPCSRAAQQAQDGERRVGLEGVVHGVRIAGERVIDRRVRVADGARAVDVDGRAGVLGDRSKAHAVAGEMPVLKGKRWMHANLAWYHARIPATDTSRAVDREGQ